MDSVHDLGGVQGFGPIPVETDEPVFHEAWEGRVFGFRVLMGFWRRWNIDANRHSLEQLPPAEYLAMSYYEKWAAGVVNLSVEKGLLSPAEVQAGHPAADGEPATPPVDAAGVLAFLPRGRPAAREIDDAPVFAVGDKVRTARNMHAGHTRLPRYLRGRVGTIMSHHGPHVFPDTSYRMEGEVAQHLYTVNFSGREIWGDDAEPGHSVSAELWESYLAPAR